MRALVIGLALTLGLAAPAGAQDAGAGTEPEAGAGAEADADPDPDADPDAPPVALPAPELEDPALPTEPAPDEPEEEEEDGRTQLLLHIGDRPPPDPPPDRGSVSAGPSDVPFVVPGDQRMPGGLSAPPRAEDDDALEPPLFEIGAGAGWSRLLANMSVDYLWLEQRFEFRIPDLPALRVGLGVAEHLRDGGLIFEIGPRVGYGIYFFDDRDLLIEAVIHVQPGYAGGDLGDSFDLAAALDLRLQVPRWFELAVSVGYALVGTNSIFKLGGSLALTF